MKRRTTAAIGLLVAATATAGLVGLSTTTASAQDATATAASAAQGFARHDGAPGADLRLDRTVQVPGGSVAHFQQYLSGRPLLGAEVVVQLDERGTLHGTTGAVSRVSRSKAGKPARTEASAERTARVSLRKAGAAQVDAAAPAETDLAWYDAAVFRGERSTGDVTLVHDVAVAPTAVDAVGGRVIVDAESGTPLYTETTQREATNRRVCDARGQYVTNLDCPSPVRTEGSAASSVTEVNTAYDRLGSTSAFYTNRFGYDLTTRIGSGALRATVRACYRDAGGDYGCPMENAFWTGRSMVFGTGFASADDVVSHELTHGVIQNTANLTYSYEAGAINESMADVFGELEDLSNGVGTDTSTSRWLLGEDLPIGAIRDMRTPERGSQPSTYKGQYWATGSSDNGGVHTNSGVGNKAAFLVTDGGSFNGQSIVGLGQTKAEQLYWRTLNALTSSATYAQLGQALNGSCSALASSGTAGFTSSDCQQVAKVVTATRM